METTQDKERRKIYKAEYYKKNKESIRNKHKEYKKKNKENNAITDKLWVKKNPEKVRASKKRYKISHPEKNLAYKSKRRGQQLNATPSWLTKEDLFHIEQYYRLAKSREMFEEIKFHVDHIIPLVNEGVCGLHVPENLRVIPAIDNMKKGNRLW
jgi:hypothetical protein